MFKKLQQIICGFLGHEMFPDFYEDPKYFILKCKNCGFLIKEKKELKNIKYEDLK